MIKKAFLAIFTILLIAALASTAHAEENPVRHIVAFKYIDEATDAQIQQVTDAFRALQHKIPGVVSFEHGVNNSPEGLNKGFKHVYVVTFEDEQARDAYLPHPEHKKFGALLEELGILEDAFVIDYSLTE